MDTKKVCVSAVHDDFEVWVNPDDTEVYAACEAVAAHLRAHPPRYQILPCIHIETYPGVLRDYAERYGVATGAY